MNALQSTQNGNLGQYNTKETKHNLISVVKLLNTFFMEITKKLYITKHYKKCPIAHKENIAFDY